MTRKGQPRLVNNTGRNDLAVAKVSADDGKIYFYIRTADTITPATGTNWMTFTGSIKKIWS